MEKFYTFENETGAGADLYVYGALVDSKDAGWGDRTDVDFADFKGPIDALEPGATLNMYINSGGGSVFAASAMVSILNRAKGKGVKINAYIDGLCASAATYLAMAADSVYIYRNSIMMVHKPMTMACGNADDLAKEIEVLDQIQNEVMIPLYMAKAKVPAAKIGEMIDAETWMSAGEIADAFDVNFIDEEKRVAACVSPELFSMYKSIPEALKTRENAILEVENPTENAKKPENPEPEPKPAPDYSEFREIIKKIKVREDF